METHFTFVIFQPPTQFKSYYVVWKPQVGCEDKMSSRRFKSYYVVWKLGTRIWSTTRDEV